MDEIGPVDYAVIAFPGNQFRGEIAPALADLVEAGTIRLIDAAFVGKDENGEVFTVEAHRARSGRAGEARRAEHRSTGARQRRGAPGHRPGARANSSAALLVWENCGRDRQAIVTRGPVAFERVPHESSRRRASGRWKRHTA